MDDGDRLGSSRLERAGRAALWWLLLALAAYVVLLATERLRIVVVPVGIALLFTALLRPTVNRLEQGGVGRGVATLVTVLGLWLLLGVIAYLVVLHASGQVPKLVDEATTTIQALRDDLLKGPLKLSATQVNDLADRATGYLQDHGDTVTSTALTGAQTLVEGATGLVLAIFVGIYLIYDGSGIWTWLLRALVPAPRRDQVDAWGHAAFASLAGFLRGQLLIALFHGTVIGVALELLGVPLAVPLGVVVALGSFIPLVGAIAAGAVAVLVSLVTQGPLTGLIVLAVLVGENQAEAHLLQPFVVGRYVRLHPLAVALGLTTGTVLQGVWGALFAVPLLAGLHAGFSAAREVPPDPTAVDEEPGGAPEVAEEVAEDVARESGAHDRSRDRTSQDA